MTTLLEVSARLLRLSLITAALVMLASLCIQVFTRYILSRSAPWSEEIAVLMFAWLILGGLALGVRERFHVAFTALPDALPGRAKVAWSVASDAVACAVGAYVFWSGLRFFDFTAGSTSAAIGYPIEILNGMIPVSSGLISIYAFDNCVRAVVGGPVSSQQAGRTS